MRKIPLIVIVLLLMLGSTGAAVEPKITVEDVSPVNPEPGDTVKVFVTLANDGDTHATFEPLQVETAEGIEYTGTTSNFRNPTELCGGCQSVGTLYFRVKENTESGTYPIDIEAVHGDLGTVKKYELSVDGNSKLTVNAESIRVSPGNSTIAEVVVENVGTGSASQIVLEPSAGKFSFEPSTISLGKLEPSEKASRSLKVSADRNAETGLKSLEMKLSYFSDGKEREKTSKLKAEVLEKARMAVSEFEIDSPAVGKQSQLTVQLENLGPGEAESISAQLKCKNAEVGSNRAFVGQIGDGESVPVAFQVTPMAEEVNCTMEASYSDSQKRKLSSRYSFSASKKSSPVVPAVIALAVLGIIIYYWRKRRQDELEEI